MTTVCPVRDHYGAPITNICTNINCDQNRLLCNQCWGSLHPNCGNFIVSIDAVLKKDYLLNINWIQNKSLRDAVATVERYKLATDRDQVIKQTRIQIENEYNNLIQAFTQEVTVAKNKTIARFNQGAVPITDVNFQDFTTRVKNIYNFTTFIEIINQWKKGTQNIDAISKRLDTFFKDSVNNEQTNQTVLAAAERVNAHSFQCSSIFNTVPFDQFKRNISMEIAKLEPDLQAPQVMNPGAPGGVNLPPPSGQNWTWDTQKISSLLQLNIDSMEVTKMQNTAWKDSAVLGNLKMTGGRYQWAIDVKDVSTRWICFGVIEPQFAEDLENFNFAQSCGFSLLSQRYNMVGENTLQSYRNQSYLCDLDLVNGTFTITCHNDGNLVELAKEKDNLKGKTLIPYIVMYLPGNTAKLRMIAPPAPQLVMQQSNAPRESIMGSRNIGIGGGMSQIGGAGSYVSVK